MNEDALKQLRNIIQNASEIKENELQACEHKYIGPTAQLAGNIVELAEFIGREVPERYPVGIQGPPGIPGRGLDDLSVVGSHRVRLMAVYEMLAELQIDGKKEGFSREARVSVKKARQLVKKAIGSVASNDETKAGAVLEKERQAKKLEKKAAKLRGETEDDDEDDDDEDDGYDD